MKFLGKTHLMSVILLREKNTNIKHLNWGGEIFAILSFLCIMCTNLHFESIWMGPYNWKNDMQICKITIWWLFICIWVTWFPLHISVNIIASDVLGLWWHAFWWLLCFLNYFSDSLVPSSHFILKNATQSELLATVRSKRLCLYLVQLIYLLLKLKSHLHSSVN